MTLGGLFLTLVFKTTSDLAKLVVVQRYLDINLMNFYNLWKPLLNLGLPSLWKNYLYLAVFSYNNAIQKSSNYSPFFANYG